MQVLYDADAAQRHPILAVVGRLQFEVVQARLEAEYGVTTVLEALPYKLARWLEGPSRGHRQPAVGPRPAAAARQPGAAGGAVPLTVRFELLFGEVSEGELFRGWRLEAEAGN